MIEQESRTRTRILKDVELEKMTEKQEESIEQHQLYEQEVTDAQVDKFRATEHNNQEISPIL